jgi:hypothetical protein
LEGPSEAAEKFVIGDAAWGFYGYEKYKIRVKGSNQP